VVISTSPADRVEQAAAAQRAVGGGGGERGGDRDDQHERAGHLVGGVGGDEPRDRGGDPGRGRPVGGREREPQRGERDGEADAVLDELDREIRRPDARGREHRRDEAGPAAAAEPRAHAVRRPGDRRPEQRGAELGAGDRIGQRRERCEQIERERRRGVRKRAMLEQRAQLDRVEVAVDAERKR
jgi:hypothetical protein